MNVTGDPALEVIGATTKTPSCLDGGCWDTCGCTENRRGGRSKTEETRISRTSGMGSKIFWWGSVFYWDPPLNFQVLPASKVGRRETSGSRASVWAELGISNQ